MAREQITVPVIDTSAATESIKRISEQVDALQRQARNLLGISFRQDNMDPIFEGGGFFCRRDTASVRAVEAAMRVAFFAGFRRSDQPAPSEERIEAAWQDWIKDR